MAELDAECERLVTGRILPVDLVTRYRQVAEAVFPPWTPAFTHGDLQIAHVFVDGDKVTGIIDWSEAGQGDALYDLPLSRWDTRSTSTTSSPATARASTWMSCARGGRCEACWRFVGWSSTDSTRLRRVARSTC